MKSAYFIKTLFLGAVLTAAQYAQAQLPLLRKTTTTSTNPANTANSIVTENNNRIGIGIAAPAAKLTVASDGSSLPTSLEISNRAYSTFPSSTSSGTFTGYNPASLTINRVALGGQNGITQYNITDLIVNSNGNVGIGTTSPTEKLQVEGNIAASGYIVAPNVYANSGLICFGTTSLYGNAAVSGNTTLNTLTASGNTTIGSPSSNANLTVNGTVKIGDVTTPTGYGLYVEKGILTEKVKCAIKSTSNWSDYVFDKDYKLLSLAEVEKFVTQNKHLPNVPSAQQVVDEGIDVAKMDAKLLEKIEELTLYLLQQEKRIKELEKAIVNPK